jgi:hypothetical protein
VPPVERKLRHPDADLGERAADKWMQPQAHARGKRLSVHADRQRCSAESGPARRRRGRTGCLVVVAGEVQAEPLRDAVHGAKPGEWTSELVAPA